MAACKFNLETRVKMAQVIFPLADNPLRKLFYTLPYTHSNRWGTTSWL
jgi:hypothetical protein